MKTKIIRMEYGIPTIDIFSFREAAEQLTKIHREKGWKVASMIYKSLRPAEKELLDIELTKLDMECACSNMPDSYLIEYTNHYIQAVVSFMIRKALSANE
ncbi:MAG: hypothetical protein ABIH39_03315 [Candidatus Margulisiibacteriota bacterium]